MLIPLSELQLNQVVEVKFWYPSFGMRWLRATIIDPMGTPPVAMLDNGVTVEIEGCSVRAPQQKTGKRVENPTSER
ncbi:MAG: hypothetical protein ACYS1A_20220 [Planctomycetota bacterium]|jgi:hypothetical protein